MGSGVLGDSPVWNVWNVWDVDRFNSLNIWQIESLKYVEAPASPTASQPARQPNGQPHRRHEQGTGMAPLCMWPAFKLIMKEKNKNKGDSQPGSQETWTGNRYGTALRVADLRTNSKEHEK